ncbi:hypothetical protein CAPTEDRAFT_58414, partial [Capitella teleta]
VFQRRKDGSHDFYSNWTEYPIGFRSFLYQLIIREFWLGNRNLHTFTTAQSHIYHTNYSWTMERATYATFSIGSEAENFVCLGGYSSDAGDSMTYHNGSQFTTQNADNDAHSGDS